MATGDASDFLGRLKAVLPAAWFPDETPVLDGLLSGPANALAWCYSLLGYVQLQARRLTASGITLDLISQDFFAGALPRRPGESDTSFNTRIGEELFREKGTRQGLIDAVTDLTGVPPFVFEPAYLADTGAWDTGTLAWDMAGGWGETDLPFQFFVIARRSLPVLTGGASGWDDPAGGWDVGGWVWTDESQSSGQITDADIYATINDVRPAATIAWTQLVNM